jgi:hypothetical protein
MMKLIHNTVKLNSKAGGQLPPDNIIETRLAVLENDVAYIKEDIREIKQSIKDLDRKFDTKLDSQFKWIIGLIITTLASNLVGIGMHFLK